MSQVQKKRRDIQFGVYLNALSRSPRDFAGDENLKFSDLECIDTKGDGAQPMCRARLIVWSTKDARLTPLFAAVPTTVSLRAIISVAVPTNGKQKDFTDGEQCESTPLRRSTTEKRLC